jgi:riboflavin synthase
MFTGIITAVSQIIRIEDLAPPSNSGAEGAHLHGKRLTIETPKGYLEDIHLGDSIALNGACMTVVSHQGSVFSVDISKESLTKTAGLDELGPVNTEKALRANDRLGGHIVSGHVDDVAQVVSFTQVGESWELRVQIPLAFAKFLAYKGSVVINGVSLTVNKVSDNEGGCEISINIIPHTIEHTTLGRLQRGSKVNLEIDTVARYVERMLAFEKKA